MLKKLLLCASAAVLVASCTDEDVAFTAGTSEFYAVQPEDDLTFGYNSIITETDSLSTVSIPLNTDVAPVISCSGRVADLQCVNIDGKYYLQVANPEKAKMGVDEVTLTVKGHPELTKSFYFTVNKSLDKTRATAPTGQKAKIYQRFADIFSQGQYIWQGPSKNHPVHHIFDPEKLYESLSSSFPLFDLDNNFANTQELQKSSGSTLDEHNNSWSVNAGIDNVKLGNYLGTLSGEGFRANKEYSKHYFEYLTESRYNCTAAGFLTTSMTSTPAHDTLWKYLITPELDNVLNNPGSKEYQKYPDTDKGACDLIEDYGSHLVTFCKLGTRATFNYRKKQDLRKTSVEWALKAKFKEIQNNKEDGVQPADEKAVAVARYVDESLVSASFGISHSYDDLVEEIESEWNYTLVGGNANAVKDIKDFTATDDPENWIPVAYNKESKKHAELRAIYELCQDPTSPRCQVLKRVLEEVDKTTGHCPFMDHLIDEYGINPNPAETEWVLAGVYVDVSVDSDKDDDGNQKTIPAPVKMALPTDQNTKATFYPFIDLAFSPGNCLDTQTSNFGKCGRGNCHYWYYAMMMRDDFPGIEEFRLVDKSKVNEFNNKGYNKCMMKGDEFGDGWAAGETGNFVLMCKPIKGNTKAKPITGFRLEAYDKHNGSDFDYIHKSTDTDLYRILAVSAPTGPGLTGEDDVYRNYWRPRLMHGPTYKYEDVVKYVTDDEDAVNDVYHLVMIHQPWHLYLSTTNEPVMQEHIHIEFPSNMRDKTTQK